MKYIEKVDKCIEYLLKEMPEYTDQALKLKLQTEKRRFMRALMNVVFPNSMPEEYFRLQDEILHEDLDEKGIIDFENLSPVYDNIYLWQGDITKLKIEAIVNAANSKMHGCFVPLHGCIDNQIHSSAGLQLRLECKDIMSKQGHDETTGTAKITKAYNLPSDYIIHTVGPIVYSQLTKKHEKQLEDCYISCLALADKKVIKSIAFCCISTGEFRFPAGIAAEIAVSAVKKYLSETTSNIRVLFNVYKDSDFNIYSSILGKKQ